jgi:transposase
MDKLLEMSAKELSRVDVMQRLSRKQMSQQEAGRILDLSTRQIKRLLKAYRAKGAAGLVSKHRGRRGNNRLSEEVIQRTLDLLQTKYKGFGPRLAHTCPGGRCQGEKLGFGGNKMQRITSCRCGIQTIEV